MEALVKKGEIKTTEKQKKSNILQVLKNIHKDYIK